MAKILVADAAVSSRLMVVKDLEESGHKVQETNNGREALKLCLMDPPDCLVLDLVLQELDGFKVMRTLQEGDYDIPIVVLTDIRMKSLENDCKRFDNVTYFKKPLASSILTATIEMLIAKRAKRVAQQELEASKMDAEGKPNPLIDS